VFSEVGDVNMLSKYCNVGDRTALLMTLDQVTIAHAQKQVAYVWSQFPQSHSTQHMLYSYKRRLFCRLEDVPRLRSLSNRWKIRHISVSGNAPCVTID